MAQPPEQLASDAERDRAVEVLRDGCAEGRLTLDDFSQRAGRALAARTRSELHELLADLPAASGAAPEPAGGVAPAGRRRSSWTVSIMGGSSRRGRWRPAARSRVVAFMGGCNLDLRGAEIEGPELTITAVALMGGVDVVVPEGIEVELSGIPVMGGKDIRVADVPVLPGSPLVRVRAFPIMGGVTVRSRPSRSGPAPGQLRA